MLCLIYYYGTRLSELYEIEFRFHERRKNSEVVKK